MFMQPSTLAGHTTQQIPCKRFRGSGGQKTSSEWDKRKGQREADRRGESKRVGHDPKDLLKGTRAAFGSW